MRYFIATNGSIVVDKLCYAGDDSRADSFVAQYIALHPGFTTQEVDCPTFDMTQVPLNQLPARNNAIATLLSGFDGNAKLMRAILLVILDELNILRQRDRDRASDVAAAASLADLKTRWAAESTLSDRTPAQGQTAVQSKLASGLSD